MRACCKSCGTDNSPAGRLMPSNASLYITHTSLCISNTLIYHYISLIYQSYIIIYYSYITIHHYISLIYHYISDIYQSYIIIFHSYIIHISLIYHSYPYALSTPDLLHLALLTHGRTQPTWTLVSSSSAHGVHRRRTVCLAVSKVRLRSSPASKSDTLSAPSTMAPY